MIKEQAKLHLPETLDDIQRSILTQPQVFLSYAWEIVGTPKLTNLQSFLTQLAGDLQTAGVVPWFDIQRMTGDLSEQMRSGIQDSQFVLLIGTHRYAERTQPDSNTNVRNELDFTLEAKKSADFLLPLMLEGDYSSTFPTINKFLIRDCRSWYSLEQGAWQSQENYIKELTRYEPLGIIPCLLGLHRRERQWIKYRQNCLKRYQEKHQALMNALKLLTTLKSPETMTISSQSSSRSSISSSSSTTDTQQLTETETQEKKREIELPLFVQKSSETKHIEEFTTLEAELKQLKIQEQQASQAAAAALLREQKLQIEHEEVKSTLASQALLLTQQGLASIGVLKAQQRLGHAVLTFVKAVDEHIKTKSELVLHPNAAASIVGGVISAFLKGGGAYNKLLQEPQQHSIHPDLITFVEEYVKEHHGLWELRTQVDFTRSLKASLYRGELAELNKQFTEEPMQEGAMAPSASTFPST